jgi:elongation factor 1-gamma
MRLQKGMTYSKSKSITGKFPVLETPEGFTIFEGTSIAKYFARQKRGFYGSNDFESKNFSFYIDLASSIDQWVDYINQSVSPISQAISQQVFGQEATDMKNFSIALNQLKKAIQPFEKHLKLRNFLVGYSLTLADVTLVVNLITPLQTVLDAGFRKDSIPNLSRYCQLILDSRAFL